MLAEGRRLTDSGALDQPNVQRGGELGTALIRGSGRHPLRVYARVREQPGGGVRIECSGVRGVTLQSDICRIVMVTHHAPSSRSVHPRYASDLLTPAFASNLEGLMDGDRVSFWIQGHMHESFDYEIFGTRVLCNPRGYAPNALNPDFRPD